MGRDYICEDKIKRDLIHLFVVYLSMLSITQTI
jgi:hypothetical protein